MTIIEFNNKKETIDIVNRELDKKLEFIYQELNKLRIKIADLENMREPKQFMGYTKR